eukprot:6159910-Prymnesium_polylepis.1
MSIDATKRKPPGRALSERRRIRLAAIGRRAESMAARLCVRRVQNMLSAMFWNTSRGLTPVG